MLGLVTFFLKIILHVYDPNEFRILFCYIGGNVAGFGYPLVTRPHREGRGAIIEAEESNDDES